MRNEKYFFPFGGLLVMWRANGLRWTIDYPETRLYIPAFYLYLNNERTLLFIGENQTRLLSPCCNVRDNRKSPPPLKKWAGFNHDCSLYCSSLKYILLHYTSGRQYSTIVYCWASLFQRVYSLCTHTYTSLNEIQSVRWWRYVRTSCSHFDTSLEPTRTLATLNNVSVSRKGRNGLIS